MRKGKALFIIAAIGLIASALLENAQAATAKERSAAKTRSRQSRKADMKKADMKNDDKEQAAFACKLGALDAAQRARHQALRAQLHDRQQEIKELPDGYGFRFTADSSTILSVAEWITLERLCCPFFNFALEVESEKESLWLRVTGREGVKQFMRMEMGVM